MYIRIWYISFSYRNFYSYAGIGDIPINFGDERHDVPPWGTLRTDTAIAKMSAPSAFDSSCVIVFLFANALCLLQYVVCNIWIRHIAILHITNLLMYVGVVICTVEKAREKKQWWGSLPTLHIIAGIRRPWSFSWAIIHPAAMVAGVALRVSASVSF